MDNDNAIDIIITWVNGNDPNWLKEFYLHSPNTVGDKSENRYRDFDFLKYWFRTIERNAPWVRKVHFVTWGHFPEWLNIEHSKLNIVNHSDFIPLEYLPTFNSCVIELNLHRINDLSDKFIYFNDDMFLMNQKKSFDFFCYDKPLDLPLFEKLNYHGGFSLTHLRNSILIQKNFSRKKMFVNNWANWINKRYTLAQNFRNIWGIFSYGTLNINAPHFAISLLKQDLTEIWNKETTYMDGVCKEKFRNYNAINPYVVRMWNIHSNNFVVRKYKMKNQSANLINSFEDNKKMIDKIFNEQYDLICLNDNMTNNHTFEETKKYINNYFNNLYPIKSSFEI